MPIMRTSRESHQKPASGTAVTKSWPNQLIIALTLAAAAATFLNAPGAIGIFDVWLLLLATAGSIGALGRRLPLQSVLFAAFITALIGAAAQGLTARTGIPFGPMAFGQTIGPKIFNTVPWAVGLIWIVAVFNSRGVARLMLRPWRKVKNYGFMVIGLTSALALAFDLALEPFARMKRFWFWQPTKIHIAWQGASPLNFIGWAFVTLIILAFVTPFLIRKQPGEQTGPDFSPLVLWLGAMALFAANAAQAGLWTAVVLDAVFAAVAALFSWRGAKW